MSAPAPPDPAPLADIERGGVVESRHVGHGVAVNLRGEPVAWFGDPQRLTYLRSSGKPFQALAMLRAGAADAFGLNSRELAVVCGSHQGEPDHLQAVRSILTKLGLDESALRCGIHPPMDLQAAERMLAAGEDAHAVHNNCSGKHAGMLTLARHLGAELEGYRDPDHPVQRRIAAVLGELLGRDTAELPRAIDGCGVPVWAAPLRNIAHAFARLATAPDGDPLARIRAAMLAHPRLVSGTGGTDTLLMQLGAGELVAKGGAEGLRCIGVRSLGLGIAVRCEDGSARGLDPALPGLLEQLGAIDARTAARMLEKLPSQVRSGAGAALAGVVPRARWRRS